MTLTTIRSVQVCKCKHGEVFHIDRLCNYPNCRCEYFSLNWYIEHHRKFNRYGEEFR